MNVIWTLEAQRDREEIFEFNAAGDPLDAIRMDEQVSSAAQRLAYQPLKGRAGRVIATREHLAHEHCRLVYETRDDSLAIIAIGAEDIDGVHARLAAAGLPVGALAQASRPIHYGARRGDALFRWFMLSAPSTPESLVCFVRNERPELIFQPEVQQHPNGARALESVILCSNEPEALAARYAGYADTAVVKVAPGLVRCALDGGVVWVGTAEALNAHFGEAIEHSPGDAPRAVGFGIAPDRVYWVSKGNGR